MPRWTTLHLFDEEKFKTKVVPLIKEDPKNQREEIIDFLSRFRIGGLKNVTEEKLEGLIIEISNKRAEALYFLDDSLRIKKQFDRQKEEGFYALLQYDNYYFARFLEYVVFKYCADFFPHVPLGKSGLYRLCSQKTGTMLNSILYSFGDNGGIYSEDSMGIDDWISVEDTELLYHSIDDLDHRENDRAVEAAIRLIRIAYREKLGLVLGQDLRESSLERLAPFKILSKSYWQKENTEGMLFKR